MQSRLREPPKEPVLFSGSRFLVCYRTIVQKSCSKQHLGTPIAPNRQPVSKTMWSSNPDYRRIYIELIPWNRCHRSKQFSDR